MDLIEITPRELRCGIGACPSIFTTDEDTYIIVGREITGELPPALKTRLGPGEFAIEIPKRLVDLKINPGE